MVETLVKVLTVHVVKSGLRIKLKVLELLKLSKDALLKSQKELTLKGFMHQDWHEGIFVALLPEIHQWMQLLSWKLVILEHLLVLDLIICVNLFVYNFETLTEHVNLLVDLIHIIFIFENHFLVDVSHFELEVFGAHRQT